MRAHQGYDRGFTLIVTPQSNPIIKFKCFLSSSYSNALLITTLHTPYSQPHTTPLKSPRTSALSSHMPSTSFQQ